MFRRILRLLEVFKDAMIDWWCLSWGEGRRALAHVPGIFTPVTWWFFCFFICVMFLSFFFFLKTFAYSIFGLQHSSFLCERSSRYCSNLVISLKLMDLPILSLAMPRLLFWLSIEPFEHVIDFPSKINSLETMYIYYLWFLHSQNNVGTKYMLNR